MNGYNIEAEKYVIGCLMIDAELGKEIRFKHDITSILFMPFFKAVEDIVAEGKVPDLTEIFPRLSSSYIQQHDFSEMAASIPTTANFSHWQRQIIKAYRRRKIEREARAFIEKSQEALTDDMVDQFIANIQEATTDEFEETEFDLKQTLLEMFDQAESGETDAGLKTGFDDYDKLVGSHRNGDLIIVGGRPSTGKTAFALNISNGHMDEEDAFAHMYSLEMRSKQLLKRMICATGRIDANKFRNQKNLFSDDDWRRYSNAMQIISTKSLYIHDKSTVKIAEIYSRTRQLMRKYPDKKHFVMIDYLQLLTPTVKRGNRQEEVSEMSRQLKVMAMDLNIPVIVLSQLSRGVESRQNKRPILSDLRESGSIEQDADVVAFLYRDDYYEHDSDAKDVIEIIVAKQRDGAVGTVELAFKKEFSLFTNLARYAM